MAWPQATDYYDAIQNPRIAFKDAELRAGNAAVNALGMPLPRSGNFADVYEVRSADRERCWAVKCFTRDMPDRERRFAGISQHLEQRPLPFMVDFRYLADGILIGGVWFPVVKMRWIEGQTLNEFVRTRADKPQSLLRLAALWRRLAHELRGANIAHGDLQHGNVLLVETAAGKLGLKLLDYDGMYVPALANIRSGEVGHPNYQHPQRARDGIYDFEMDRFAHLVIYLALRAVAAAGQRLWDQYDNGDNLLFREADFTNPAGSPLLRELLRAPEVAVQILAGHLLLGAEGEIPRVPLITDIVREDGSAVPLAPPQVQELRGLLARGGPARVVPTLAAPVAVSPSWQTSPPPVRLQTATAALPVATPASPVIISPPPPRTRTRPQPRARLTSLPIWARILIVLVPMTLVGLGGLTALFVFGSGPWSSSRERPTPTPDTTAVYRERQPPPTRRENPSRTQPPPVVPPREQPEPKKPANSSPPTVSGGSSSDKVAIGQLVKSFDHTHRDSGHRPHIWSVLFVDNGKLAISIGEDGSVRFWKLDIMGGGPSMNVGAPGLNEIYRSAALSPLGDKIVIACDTGLAEIGWRDLSLQRIGYTKNVPAAVTSEVGYIRSGDFQQRFVLSGGPDSLRRWDMRSQKIDLNIQGIGQAPFVMTPTGEVIVMKDQKRLPGWVAPVMYNAITMAEVRQFNMVAGPIAHLAIDNAALNLIGASTTGIITHWNVKTGDRIVQKGFGGSNVTVLALDGFGNRGLAGTDSGKVNVWRLGSTEAHLVLSGHIGAVRSAAFSPDGKQVLTGGDDNTVKLWRLE
jgi:WD40 domain-containing protein